ncbi:MAG: hypothetical protein AB8H12_17030 [Lewinella sp.]
MKFKKYFTRYLQGGILSHHGRTYCAYLLVEFEKSDENLPSQISLINELGEIATSQFKQSEEKVKYMKSKKDDNFKYVEDCFFSIGLTVNGFLKLEIDESIWPNDRYWKSGLSNTSSEMNLYGLYDEEEGYSSKDYVFSSEVDLVLTIAHSNIESVKSKIKEITELKNFIGSVKSLEPYAIDGDSVNENVKSKIIFGSKLNYQGECLGPLGFSDGRSNPQSISDKIDVALFEEKESFVRIDEGGVSVRPTLYGSFGVFMKILVFPKVFNHEMKIIQEQHKNNTNENIPINKVEAMYMGRFKDGTPVVNSGTPQTEMGYSIDGEDIPFDYKGDRGVACPYHAHVRRMNPRNDLSNGYLEVMIRRGMNLYDDDKKEFQGLCFHSFQKKTKTFVKTMSRMNDKNTDEFDALLYPHRRSVEEINKNTFTFPASHQGEHDMDGIRPLGNRVTKILGGAFLYYPSIEFMKQLSLENYNRGITFGGEGSWWRFFYSITNLFHRIVKK